MKKTLLDLRFFVFTLLVGLSLPRSAAAAADSDLFGTIAVPQGVDKYQALSPSGIGIIPFASSALRLGSVGAGIWVMFNFLKAGWIYVFSSGDTGAHKKVTELATMSIIGIALIVSSYTVAGIVGLVFFGDASFILNPKFEGVGDVNSLPMDPPQPVM